MKTAIIIKTGRDAYGIDDIENDTLTIKELIAKLEELADDYDEDYPVVLSNDDGYTYGYLSKSRIKVVDYDEDYTYEGM